MNIKAVTQDNLSQLRDLMEATFLEAFAHLNQVGDLEIYKTQNLSKDKILSELENKNSFFYFIHHDGQVAGYLKLNIKEAQTNNLLDNALEIERIYLLKTFQGKGLGKILFNFSEDMAIKRGHAWLWLGVWEKNDQAIEFYKRQGLERFGTHDFLMGNERQIDILMKKAI